MAGAHSFISRVARSRSIPRTGIAARTEELIRQIVHHDGELTACYEYGLPNFHALHFHNGRTERCIWAFFERSLAGCREDQTRLGASPQYLVSLPGESR
jgi:hypothetical protein